MNFSFEKFNEIVNKKKLDIVKDNSFVNYPYMTMFGQYSVDEINFERLTVEGIEKARDGMAEAITFEDEDGNILLDPEHPMYQILCIEYKIMGFEAAPKQVLPSSYRFL